MHMDIFNGEAFNLVNMTAAMNDLPHVPGQVGAMGLFSESGITTTSVSVERVGLSLNLVAAKPRGAKGEVPERQRRTLRNIPVVHLPQSDAINADEVQNVRAFGTDNELQTAQALVNQRLAQLKLNNDVTMEWQRVGALRGQILDSDGATVLIDLFSEFGMTQTTHDMALDSDSTKVKVKCVEVQRKIEAKLGGIPYTGIHVLCSEEFFDALTGHPAVESAFDRWMNGEFMRTQQRNLNGGGSFFYSNVLWEEYRGKVANTRFIPQNKALAIPLGVPGLFRTLYAPADYFETVNTLGLPYYAKLIPDRSGRNVEIEAQSNPLMLNTRPEVVVELSI